MTIPREVRIAAEAVRDATPACLNKERVVPCEHCFSDRYRGCVYLAHAAVTALTKEKLS